LETATFADSDEARAESAVGAAGGMGPSGEEVLAWWRKTCLALLSQQQEAIAWGFDLAASCANAETWMRSAAKLGRDLSAAGADAARKGAHLTVQQHRAVAGMVKESHGLFKPALTPSLPAGSPGLWPQAAEMARAWSAYVVATQAQAATAWAEFWQLPHAGY